MKHFSIVNRIALSTAIYLLVTAPTPAATNTATYQLGAAGSGTVIAGHSYQPWIAKGALPTGSILRAVTINAKLESTNASNWAMDLMVLFDPTPLTPGEDCLLAIGNGDSIGQNLNLIWANGFDGPGTAVTDTKTAPANFPATTDLHNVGIFLTNTVGGPLTGGTWSGSVTITYDSPDVACIKTFGLSGYPALISGTHITWNLPLGTTLTNLAPTYTLGSGTCNKPSGSIQNFSNPLTYTVTDGAVVNVYTVTAVLVPPVAMIQVNLDTAARTGLTGPASNIGTTWNQLLAPPPLAATGLLDSNGVTTTVGVTCDAANVSSWGAPALKLLTGGAFQTNWDSPASLVISGLTPGIHHTLYLASFYPNELGGKSLFLTTNRSTTASPQVADNGGPNGNSSTWVQGANYVRFDNLEPDSGNKITVTLIGNSGTNQRRAYLSGFQLVYDGPLAPLNLTAAPIKSQVGLSWSAWSGATGYHVKRSLTSGGPYTTLATVTGRSYTDRAVANGTTYYYVVSATQTLGESANSTEVSAVPAASPAKDILAFGPGAAMIDTDIFWTVPLGTVVTNLAPTFTLSPFATCTPTSGTSRNFSSHQTYTVTAEDGGSRVYHVTLRMADYPATATVFTTTPLNVSATATGAEILNTGTLIEANHVGAGGEAPLTLANGLTFGISTASLINPNDGNQDAFPVSLGSTGWRHNSSDNQGYAITNSAFNNLMNHAWWMGYTDSRSDMCINGLTIGRTYRLQLISEAPNNGTVALEGSPETTWSGNPSVMTVTWTAQDTSLNMQYSRKQQASSGGQGDEVHFQGYALHDITPPNALNSITRFTFPGLGIAAISGNLISLNVPAGTPVTALAPTFTLSAGATCVPASGTSRDFTYPQVYVVTAANGALRVFTVAMQPTVTLSLTGSPLAEAGGTATVTATLSAAHTEDVTVVLAYAGSATLTADFTPSTSNILIPAGQLSGALTLTAVPNSVYAGTGKSIRVSIGAAYHATGFSSQALTAIIAEDDPEPIFPLVAGEHGRVTCRENPSIIYDVYLPPNYAVDGPPLPIIYTFSPTGGGEVSDFQDVAATMQIIVIGLLKFSDGIGWDEVWHEIYAVTRDVRQRLVFDPSAEMAGGWSGGGVASYGFSRFRGQHTAGVIPMGGWLGESNGIYPPEDWLRPGLLVARTTGNTDWGGLNYLTPDAIYMGSCGAIVKNFSFIGGHQVAPPDVQTAAFTWILNNRMQGGPFERATAQAQADAWQARIAAGERQAILGEAVTMLFNNRRNWYAYQAQRILDQLMDEAAFRTLDASALAQGLAARDHFYYTARGAALNNDWQNYHAAMKALAGVSGADGYRRSDIYNLVDTYGYPIPALNIGHVGGQLTLSINKDTLGLTYALEARPSLAAGSWKSQSCIPVETPTVWSTSITPPPGTTSGFYRVRVTPSLTSVP